MFTLRKIKVAVRSRRIVVINVWKKKSGSSRRAKEELWLRKIRRRVVVSLDKRIFVVTLKKKNWRLH